ncbi:type IV pilus assembly protein PilV [Mitsuaria sp. PDC51]|uniref:type IV pilus modification PilV family protein n=1 Tax=unclassified Roseateles TaxID=2626991 RepID=UPI0008E92373|nr:MULTISPECIES: prepilin-type N-terminal cleavage/methylation domain-containing protein [unclassified Roseateles]SFR89698.1 type IV pilus assembly protein PilV [Mitsuaria sp. PDC51]
MNTFSPSRARRPSRARARGMTLIELMVAMLVMTIGIVGLVALMARASQASSGADENQRAATLASEMANDMWLYNTSLPPTIAAWQARVSASGLVGAKGDVADAPVGTLANTKRITITWKTPAGDARTYYTDVRLN